ncbi:hypothetical protein GCM10027589_50280 [Actinocorallia lasiicapitis]
MEDTATEPESPELPEAPEAADDAELLLALATRLTAVEQQLGDFHRRSAHRETVIDRLHEENQVFRSGQRRAVLDPVVVDLFRLYDGLRKEASRLAGEPHGRVLESFADETELILERCGIEAFEPKPGDPFEAARHNPSSTVPTDDPARHNTVEAVLSAGFVDREAGRVRRPARARFYQFVPADPESAAPAESE